MEERRMRVFENRVLRRIFGTSDDNVEKNEMSGACSAYGERGEGYTEFWLVNLRERDHLGDPKVDGRIILKCIFRK
jgi:hypothetical protein